MLFQLNNKVFEGQLAPDSWSYSGNEANLAKYELINTKPRLQHTGETLEELSLSFRLRSDFCNVSDEILELEAWKTRGEILPLLLGDGTYLNDYVIQSVTKNIIQTLSDGVVVEAFVNIRLIEYIAESEEDRQAQMDRRNAAAVGDKKQVNRQPKQKKTSESEAHSALMTAQNEAWEAAEAAQKAKESPTPESHISDVKRKVKAAQEGMQSARDQISDVQQQVNNATGIIASINNTVNKLQEMTQLLTPPLSLSNLDASILNLQSSLRGIDQNATIFSQDVILRKR